MDNLETLATLGRQIKDENKENKTQHRKLKRRATWTPPPKKTGVSPVARNKDRVSPVAREVNI
jgi:hypothetical protein